MKITYIEKEFIGKYICIKTEKTFHALDYFIPENTSLYYFYLDRYNLKTVAKEDIVKIEK